MATYTISCFGGYSDKKNTDKNLKTPAVVFTCNAEHTVVQYCITFLQKTRWVSFVLFFTQPYLSQVVEFLLRDIFHNRILLSLDILLTAPPSLDQIDYSRNNS